LFSLTDFAQRPYTSLSGGEKQRVQICRVVSQVIDDLSHAHLLFDEPIAPLDIAHQVAFFRLVRGFAAQGTAVGLVLHDIELACQFCDEIILMSAGKILGAGKPAAVITSDSIQQAFDVSATVTKGPAGAIQLIFAD
jgi:iron complex transport system ATP-binding protein